MHADDRFKPLPIEATTLLSEGQVVAAVKAAHDTEGVSHREARKLLFWVLVIDVIIVAAVYWFFYRGSA